MEKLKMSPAEILKGVTIKPIEQECLDRVFSYLSTFLSFFELFAYSSYLL